MNHMQEVIDLPLARPARAWPSLRLPPWTVSWLQVGPLALILGVLLAAPIVLFLVVFFWTPPHFWALALMIKEHYAAANVPMLPGTKGIRETTRQILLYSVVMVAFTIAVGWWLGPVYTVAAALLGAYFLLLAWQLRRDTSRKRAVMLFHYSLAYLALLFVAAAVNPLLV